jgi:hypothetical protein
MSKQPDSDSSASLEPVAAAAVGVRPDVSATESAKHRADPVEFGAQPASKFDKSGSRQAVAFAIAVAGWLVPGLGHALLKMWGRALACFLTVAVLVIIGAGMRGNIFDSSGVDAFDRLGYFADMGTGCFYFLARAIEHFGADVSHANGDYGTRFLATAGILNLLSALHAFEAARGHKA